ncbi:MAG: glycosyltransferase, partial [Betaproteobacteria bacterium]|nr:glycosyltransferase [Betaproteobacteria bacterium]
MPKDFSIIITALDETWSLEQTITQTVEENSCDIAKIVIVTAQRATPECRAMVAKVISQHPDLVSEHRQQQLPGVGGGIRESLPAIGSAWVVMMA